MNDKEATEFLAKSLGPIFEAAQYPSIQDALLKGPSLMEACKKRAEDPEYQKWAKEHVHFQTPEEAEAARKGDGHWHLIHDIMYGYGWTKTDNYVFSRITFGDIGQFLPELEKDLWQRAMKEWRDGWDRKKGEPYIRQVEDAELDEIFDKLMPFFEEQRQKRIQWEKDHPPIEEMFNKITIPLVRKKFPPL